MWRRSCWALTGASVTTTFAASVSDLIADGGEFKKDCLNAKSVCDLTYRTMGGDDGLQAQDESLSLIDLICMQLATTRADREATAFSQLSSEFPERCAVPDFGERLP